MDEATIGGRPLKPNVLGRDQGAARRLLAGKSTGTSQLAQIEAKRSADTVKFTYLMLQTRLTRDLDETLAGHLEEHPDIKDDFFIAIMTDSQLSVEVVPRSQAEETISALPDDKKGALGSDPIGYFTKREFPLTTPNDERYRDFKDKLDQYFKRNAEVIAYLRNNPNANVDPSSLYNAPAS